MLARSLQMIAVGALVLVLAVGLGFVPPHTPVCGSFFVGPTVLYRAVCETDGQGFALPVVVFVAVGVLLVAAGVALAVSVRLAAGRRNRPVHIA